MSFGQWTSNADVVAVVFQANVKMLGAFLDLITLRRFYSVPPSVTDRSASNPPPDRSGSAPLDPNREASDLSNHTAKALKLCDKMALLAVEDAIYLMERLYVEQFGQKV